MTDCIASLILTRPRAGSEAFLAQIDPTVLQRVNVVTSPLLEIVPTGMVPDLTGIDGVIFTSANGVAVAGDGHDVPAYCVGKATTARANENGWQAQFCGGCADALVESLRARTPEGPLLHIAGVQRRGEIAERLTQLGCETRVVEVYDQHLCDLTPEAVDALSREKPVIVPLFSPRTARHFKAQVAGGGALHLIGLSDAVMDEVNDLPATTRQVARRADVQAMSDSVTNFLRWVEAGGAPQ